MKARRLVLATALVALVLLPFAPTASATASVYTLNLLVPNTAQSASSGDVIRVTGAVTFDTDAETVVGGGSFAHFDSSGGTLARGRWQASGFTSFVSFGGPSNGFQGGILVITATLFPGGGAAVTGVTFTMTCAVNAPPGTEDSLTVDFPSGQDFLTPTGGFNLVHLHA